MKVVVITTKLEAQALQAQISVAMGYPRRGYRPTGEPVGPGSYSPNAYGWTVEYGSLLEHPTKNLWAVSLDEAALVELAKEGSVLKVEEVTAADWSLIVGTVEEVEEKIS